MDNEELVLLIKQGKTEYYAQLWEQTEKLIRKLIYKMWIGKTIHHTIDFEDLLQCGYFALVMAVKYYDSDKMLRFATYLSRCIKSTINKELRTSTSTADKYTISLETPLNSDDEEFTMYETVEDETAAEAFKAIELTDTQRIVREALTRLPTQQAEIIKQHYLYGKSYQEMSKCLNISAERVRQLSAKAIRNLRKDSAIRELYDEYNTHYHSKSMFVDPQEYITRWMNYGKRENIS